MDLGIIITSAVALAVSIISAFISLKNEGSKIKTDTITKNRIQWNKDVRNLLIRFLRVYMDTTLDENKKKEKLLLLKNTIRLFLRESVVAQKELVDALTKCAYNPNKGKRMKNINKVIIKSQIVLSESWTRAKIETGISQKEDKDVDKWLHSGK